MASELHMKASEIFVQACELEPRAAGVFEAPVGRVVLAFDLLLAILFGYFLFVSWVVPARRE